MFVDEAKIYVKAGDGGRGCVSFLRLPYNPRGGPNGGDGGAGGNVIIRADPNLQTLLDQKYNQHYRAQNGAHGKGKMQDGRHGADEIIRVPLGTVIRDAETGTVLADLCTAGEEYIVARGGRGGRGNSKFKSSTNQAPRYAEPGEPGEERWLWLELKLLADVGLVGLPNAGKSTLIRQISAAKPKVADYPFTTLTPNLGTVTLPSDHTLVVADIPGLIAGASAGKGLGSRFLRHIERTKILVHLVDMSETWRDPFTDFLTINQELEHYHPSLLAKPQIIAANKMDLPGASNRLHQFQIRCMEQGVLYPIYPISSLTGQGISALVQAMVSLLTEWKEQEAQGAEVLVEGHCHR